MRLQTELPQNIRNSYGGWVTYRVLTEKQARRLLEDYDKMEVGVKFYSKSFGDIVIGWVEYYFTKYSCGSVIMTRVDYNR